MKILLRHREIIYSYFSRSREIISFEFTKEILKQKKYHEYLVILMDNSINSLGEAKTLRLNAEKFRSEIIH